MSYFLKNPFDAGPWKGDGKLPSVACHLTAGAGENSPFDRTGRLIER